MIRVGIVDGMGASRDLLSTFLREESDIEVVGTASTVEEGLPLLRRADVVVVSASLPDDGALRLPADKCRSDLPAKVLVFGVPNSPSLIVRHVEAGADGYVLRDDSREELLRKIRATREGRSLISPEVAGSLVCRVAELVLLCEEKGIEIDRLRDLTPRERDVFRLIRKRYSNKEIARQLGIELGTVKNHVHKILTKLGVRSRREAALFGPLPEEE